MLFLENNGLNQKPTTYCKKALTAKLSLLKYEQIVS